MIIALAGRRVDAANTSESRFPVRNTNLVTIRVREFIERERAGAIVSAAACGADLIALGEAGRLGVRRRVVLPFARDRFRQTSVTDRPGDWGPVYDQILDEVEAHGDLLVMNLEAEQEAFLAVNRAILDEAMRLGKEAKADVAALLVWDGASRGAGDLTEAFGAEARRRGLPVLEIRTL